MKKDALQLLAAYGVRHKLALMERELRELHRDFPEAFASETPPTLLRPERKPNGNDWPALAVTDETAIAPAAQRSRKGWTPERRKTHARFMKSPAGRATTAKMIAGKRKANKQKKQQANGAATAKWGTRSWQRAHDFLVKQPSRTAHIDQIMAGAKINSAAGFITGSYDNHKDLFERLGKGEYKLKKVMEH